MNYADIVLPEEMREAKQWFKMAWGAMRAGQSPASHPTVNCLRQDWGRPQNGRSIGGTPLRLNGRTYATGIGTHAESLLEVILPGPGRRLTGWAGVDDNEHTRRESKPLTFAVEAGSGVIWRREALAVDRSPARLDVELPGQREFVLQVTGPISYGHANWADLKATLADGTVVTLGQPRKECHCLSFTYGGKPSTEFLHTWSVKEEHTRAKDGVAMHRVTRTDHKTGLQAIVEIKEYTEFPVVEWVARFKNTGSHDTPILEAIRSLDMRLPATGAILNYHTGDYCAADGYEPHRVTLEAGRELSFAPDGGRPTNRAWPYYNIERHDGKSGVIAVVGWSGQWASHFHADDEGVRMTAGQELTHFKLLPGEEVRTPMSVLMFWRGDRIRSQNLWRRWMMACNMPRPGGKLPAPLLAGNTSLWFNEMGQATDKDQIYFIDRYLKEGVKLDYWWMDAGWYPCKGEWWHTGTWEPDPQRFPRGLRAVSDHANAKGLKTLVWFEPERVTAGSWLAEKHPEWLLETEGPNKLLDLGNPQAQGWLTQHVIDLIGREGISLYRQDFNFDPLPYWRAHDAPDRQGITEIRHVEGYLAYWKALTQAYPDMLLDSCASGGRRNDLETMRLAVPLHKTDYNYWDLSSKQGIHYGLFSWIPYFATGVIPLETVDVHAFRNAFTLMMVIGFDMRRKDLDYALMARQCRDWRRVAPYLYGDYYPLTPYSRAEENWLGWQFHRPDLGEGMVQFFRRARSPFISGRFKLHGLNPRATYRVTNLDTPKKSAKLTGKELMESGLPVEMAQAPASAVVVYEKA